MVKFIKLLISIAIPLAVGYTSSFFVSDSMGYYQTLDKPWFSPPGEVFPIVWSILYVLMGISAYLISKERNSDVALRVYFLQLVLNFFWSIIFFRFNLYLVAFVWIIGLIIVVAYMIYQFWYKNKTAAILQIPYFLWLVFAGILNFSIFLLNR